MITINAEILKHAGIDYESGVSRFMDDVEIYESVLERFLEDTTLKRATEALERRDAAEMMKAVHEIKGVSANMDMTDIYRTSSALTMLLRSQEHDWDEIIGSYEEFKRAYTRAADGIAEAMRA